MKYPIHILVVIIAAAYVMSGCSTKEELAREEAADAQENAALWHREHDPYRVFQYSSTGVPIGHWVSDGEPEAVDDLTFTELGTGHHIRVSKPYHSEQAPGATSDPQPNQPQ